MGEKSKYKEKRKAKKRSKIRKRSKTRLREWVSVHGALTLASKREDNLISFKNGLCLIPKELPWKREKTLIRN